MDQETAKAINNISKRITNVEQKVVQYLIERQEITNNGLADIGNIVSTYGEAITNLTNIISTINEGGK